MPFFGLGLLGLVAAERLPLRYLSQARLLVEQQRVSDQYVAPNIVASLQDRLDRATQQILSRNSLEQIVRRLNQHQQESARENMDQAVAALRKSIVIEVTPAQGSQGELATCRIACSSTSPRMAQKITDLLTALFIDENLHSESQQSVDTTAFLESELEDARNNLATQEDRLRDYKMRFVGQLPDQQQLNLQILGGLQSQLQTSTSALQRAEQQQVYLESMRTHYETLADELSGRDASAPRTGDPVARGSASNQSSIQALRKELTDLSARYTPSHPDIIALKARITEWEARKDLGRGESKPDEVVNPDPATLAAIRSNRAAAFEFEGRLKASAAEITGLRKETEELRKRISAAEARLELTPVREQQLAELTRSSENARTYYGQLLQKKLQSAMATKLGKRQLDERFRVLDPARLPLQPEGKRKVIGVGWLLGLLVGAALIVLREKADATIHGRDDITECSSLPVLASIPLLRSERERRRRRWTLRVEPVCVALLALMSVAATLRSYMGKW